MNSLKLWIVQVDLCSQDHMWSSILRPSGGIWGFQKCDWPGGQNSSVVSLLHLVPSEVSASFSSPGFFWARQLLRAARCISSRPRELLLTAAMQDPASIPDQSAPELRRRADQLTTQSKEQVSTELLSLQRKGRPVSSTCCFSSDCCFIFTVSLQFQHKWTINDKYYIYDSLFPKWWIKTVIKGLEVFLSNFTCWHCSYINQKHIEWTHFVHSVIEQHKHFLKTNENT